MSDIDLIGIDARGLIDAIKTAYYNDTGETLQIGSDEYAAAAAFAYVWSVLIGKINDATLNRFIDSANGVFLDSIASNYGIESRPLGYSATALFSFDYQYDYINIPAGAIIVEDDNGRQFTNRYKFQGYTGQSHVLYAVEPGDAYNGIPANAIDNIVQGGTYITAAHNANMTAGGTSSMEGDDDAFRAWLKIQIQSFAGAGTYQAYEARAKNADSRVTDVYVLRQDDAGYQKGKVQIFILSDSDSDPDHDCVEIVQNACDDELFRPIGDLVVTSYAPTYTESLTKTIQTTYPARFSAVASARNSRIVNEYADEIKRTINRPFVFEELCAKLCAIDDDGVYCTDAKPLGLIYSTAPQPIYPPPGNVLQITSFNWNIQFDDKAGA